MNLFRVWSMMARQWLDMMDEMMSPMALMVPMAPLAPAQFYRPTHPDGADWEA